MSAGGAKAAALGLVALLAVGCRTRPLPDVDLAMAADLSAAGGSPVDLGSVVDLSHPADLASVDLLSVDLARPGCGSQTCGPSQACVIPCCGGAGPQCTPAPDGGCVPPMQQCPFGGSSCYLPCTPPAPFCVDLPSACVVGDPATNLCGCLLKHGGTDPCWTHAAGDNCADNITNLPLGQIWCLCY